MLDTICQIWICVFGGIAIWLVGQKNIERRKWGYIFGFLSQPAWLITTLLNKQWGIFVIALWYTYSWLQGVYNHSLSRG